jgi:putative inorganic carbon (HCO3(-)) transporter
VVQRIEQTDVRGEGRAQLLVDIPPLLERYHLTGTGIGTFEQAYAQVRSAAMRQYFDHAHNDYVEFAVEVGIPGLILLALLVGVHALHAIMVIIRRKRRLPAGVAFAALMALLAQGIHATVEFNLQIPANAATLIVLMAASASCSSQGSRRRKISKVKPVENQGLAPACAPPQQG